MRNRKVIIIVAVFVLLFIWIQSAVPEKKSAHESDWFRINVVNPVARFLNQPEPTKDDVRKAAHAVEFGILSIVVVILWKGNIVRSFYTGFTVAFLDESLQILTKRGALVKDVWVDLIGVAIGTAIGYLIWKTKANRSL